MVGDRGDSRAYVESKKKACADVGFESYSASLSENISEELLLKVNAGCGTTVVVAMLVVVKSAVLSTGAY